MLWQAQAGQWVNTEITGGLPKRASGKQANRQTSVKGYCEGSVKSGTGEREREWERERVGEEGIPHDL